MLVAVNTRFLLKDKLEGIGWFTYETMKRLTQQYPQHRFLFLFDRDWDEEFIFSDNIIPVKVWPPARHPYLWQFWFDYSLPKVFKRYKPDIFLSTDGFLSLKTHVPTVMVVHDLGFEHYPEHTPAIVSKFYRKFTPIYAKKAARIISVSEFSKKDIVERYHINPDKIDVVHNGASELYIPLADEEKFVTRQNFTGGKNYLLYVGSIHPRKNVKNLLQAYDEVRKEGGTDLKLVIAGRMAWKTDETTQLYENMEFKNDVIFTGHLQLSDLTQLVASADAMVYPSLFEGFGIPALEARYCGVPVISSNRASLPEVAGEDAIYFDPENIGDLKNAILKFVQNKEYYFAKAKNIAKAKQAFNWDKSADGIANALAKVDKRFMAFTHAAEVA